MIRIWYHAESVEINERARLHELDQDEVKTRWKPKLHYITLLFSSLPIGAFQWPITSSISLMLLSLDYLSLQQLRCYVPNSVYPNPPCQFSLWEETGVPEENPRLSAERWLTLFTWVRSENPTHELRGERRLLWRLPHRSPISSHETDFFNLLAIFSISSLAHFFFTVLLWAFQS